MARFNPRYGTNTGYAAGDALIQLSQLLRQGVGDYQRQQTIDEESGRRDQDYMLRLQQFMAQQQDQGLDRQLKERQITGLEEDLKEKVRLRDAEAQGAAAKRSGLFKALTMPQDVTTESAPPPEFAADPERLQPNILQALVKNPRTLAESTEGMTPDEAGQPDVVELLMKRFGQKDLPPKPKFSQGAMGVLDENTGAITTPRPPEPVKPEAPSAERTILGAARSELVKSGVAEPTEDQIFERAVSIKERLGKAGAANTTIKLGAEERKDERLAVNTEALGTSILAQIKKNPDWVGGALGIKGRANSVRAMLDAAPQGFPDFESNLDKMSADMINILAGAALSANEEKRYTRSIPKITDSTQKFESNLRVTIENARRLRGYIQARERGEKLAPPPPADEDTQSAPPPGFTPRSR